MPMPPAMNAAKSMAIWLAPYELSSPKAITSTASNKIRAKTGTKDSPKEGMAGCCGIMRWL